MKLVKTKPCSQCGVPKLLTEFTNLYSCKDCRNKRVRAKEAANKIEAKKKPKVWKPRHPWELLGIDCRPKWN